MAAVYFIFFAEVAAYRAGTRRLQRLGINYSVSLLCPREADISWHLPQGSHAHDETDAHAHTHDHEPPLGVDVTAPAPDHHIHPDHSNITSHPHGHHRTSSGEKGKDAESASDVSTVNQLPSQAEAAAQLIAVAVLEFGVVLHSWVFLDKAIASSMHWLILPVLSSVLLSLSTNPSLPSLLSSSSTKCSKVSVSAPVSQSSLFPKICGGRGTPPPFSTLYAHLLASPSVSVFDPPTTVTVRKPTSFQVSSMPLRLVSCFTPVSSNCSPMRCC